MVFHPKDSMNIFCDTCLWTPKDVEFGAWFGVVKRIDEKNFHLAKLDIVNGCVSLFASMIRYYRNSLDNSGITVYV